MKTDYKQLGWPLRIVSYLYVVFMLINMLGLVFFPTGANFLFAFGPKSYLYILLYGLFGAIWGEFAAATVWLCIGTATVVFAVTLGICVYANVKKRYVLLFVAAVTDVSAACLLCLVLEMQVMWFVLLNVLYCVWLGTAVLKKQRHIHDEGE